MKYDSRVGLVLLVLAVVGWFALVAPQTKQLTTKIGNVKVKQVELNSYNQRLSDLQTLNSSKASLGDLITKLSLAMPTTAQIPESLVMIESIAKNSGVALSSVSVGTPTDVEVPVSFTFSGDMSRLTDFLSKLNSNIRTIAVHSQTLTSDLGGNMSINVQAGLIYQSAGGTSL